jgi:hypothetical protein
MSQANDGGPPLHGTAAADLPAGERPRPLRLGGMALRNGLLVHGPTHWALVKRSLPEARLPFADPAVALTATAAAGAAAALRRRTHGSAAGELAAALVSIAPAVTALRGGDLAAYHGVEHKAIGAYEQGAQDASSATKEHDRCGSHLLAPMLSLNLLGTLALRHTYLRNRQWAAGAVALAALGASMELLAWSERHHDGAVARALRRPGYELQRVLGTREPDERQLDVGRAALAEIVRAESAGT